jgi:hypothetical protein
MADVFGELALPGGDEAAPILTVQHFTRLATGIMVSQLGLLASAAAMSHLRNNSFWGFVMFVPSLFMVLLVWAASLDRRCPLWPLRVSVVTAFATFIQGFFTSHYQIVVVAKSYNYGGQIFTLLLFDIFVPVTTIKTVEMCRRCVQVQYSAGDKMLGK